MDSFDFGDRPYRVFDVEHVVRDRLGVENDCGGQLHYVMPKMFLASREQACLFPTQPFNAIPQGEPRCVLFGMCGGCAYQDVPYEKQLELKSGMVRSALSAFLPDPSILKEAIPSPKPYYYRHTISLTVRRRQDGLKLGFVGWFQDTETEKIRRRFLEVNHCSIADERLNAFIPAALSKLYELPEKRRFRTSQIVLRAGSGGEVVTSLRPDRKRSLEAEVGGKHFAFPVSGFFQHNFSILPAMVEAVRVLLKPSAGGTLFDLYSGVGLFGISLAENYREVIGIEEGYEAVRYAEQNARANGVANATFHEGKVEQLLPAFALRASGSGVHAIVDPPRRGLKPEVIQVLKRMPVEKLLYVSCSLESLTRDLAQLDDVFKVQAVQPIDLFPQTRHIETLVLLEPKG